MSAFSEARAFLFASAFNQSESEGEAAAPAEAVANSNQPSNQSSSPKVEESNETKVPTTTTIETESREDQSSYVAPSSSSVEEAAKPEHLKGSSSTINVESASENMNNDVEEEKEKDVEKFGGKIVYNPDGSAYIIDDEDDADDAVPALQGRYSVLWSNSKPSFI